MRHCSATLKIKIKNIKKCLNSKKINQIPICTKIATSINLAKKKLLKNLDNPALPLHHLTCAVVGNAQHEMLQKLPPKIAPYQAVQVPTLNLNLSAKEKKDLSLPTKTTKSRTTKPKKSKTNKNPNSNNPKIKTLDPLKKLANITIPTPVILEKNTLQDPTLTKKIPKKNLSNPPQEKTFLFQKQNKTPNATDATLLKQKNQVSGKKSSLSLA